MLLLLISHLIVAECFSGGVICHKVSLYCHGNSQQWWDGNPKEWQQTAEKETC